MNVTAQETTQQVVNGMAEELSMAATEAWNLYAFGLQLEAAATLGAVIIAILAAYGTYKFMLKQIKKDMDELHGANNMFALMFGLLGGIIGGFIGGFVLDQIVTIILPEYRMIGDLAQFAGETVR